MKETIVKLGRKSYPIKIGSGIINEAGSYLARLDIGKSCIIVTNSKVRRLYAKALRRSLREKGIESRIEVVPDSETSKSHKVFFKLIDRIARFDRGQKPFIIALGGGVVGDLAGFVAAVYRRGVPLIEIPTTLLAQVDSSIGGKVAIDAPVAKNLVGAFYQPAIVIADTSVLKTLPTREIKCGLAEVIKYAVIESQPFFEFLDKNIEALKRLERKKLEYVIKRCCDIKAKIVGADEKDVKGRRALLNYGHTIGHAMEAASGYRGRYNHGEAVSVGMIAAAKISNKMGMLSKKDESAIIGLIKKAGLPTAIKGLSASSVFKAHLYDKKFTGNVNAFVLPAKIGMAAVVKNVPRDIIVETIRSLVK